MRSRLRKLAKRANAHFGADLIECNHGFVVWHEPTSLSPAKYSGARERTQSKSVESLGRITSLGKCLSAHRRAQGLIAFQLLFRSRLSGLGIAGGGEINE